MAEPEMTNAVRVELEALKSAARVVADWSQWTVVEYARSADVWYVQMVTNEGPRAYRYEAVIEYASRIRRFHMRYPDVDTLQEAIAMGAELEVIEATEVPSTPEDSPM